MNRPFICLFIYSALVFHPLFLHAQVEPNVEIQDLQAPPLRVLPAHSILWEVSGNGLQKPSYIYAILNKVSSDFFFLPPGLNQIIDKSDKWLMEVNPVELDFDHLYRGDLPVDSTLARTMPRKQYTELEKFVKDSLSSLALYKLNNRYAPALLTQQFISDYCLGYKYGDEPVDYEQYLYQAISKKKPFQSLDAAWSRVFREDNYSLAEQTSFLVQSIENRSFFCENYSRLQWAYRNGDLDQVWLAARELPALGNYEMNFLEARTENWLKSIVWQMRYESLFMVVQAPLLPGEYGMLHRLRKLGFTVKPLTLP